MVNKKDKSSGGILGCSSIGNQTTPSELKEKGKKSGDQIQNKDPD